MRIDCDLQIEKDSFRLSVKLSVSGARFGLFGPSGAGKTTLVRALAGLERCSGRLVVDDEVWLDSASGVEKPAHQRHAGWVPQENALLPHLNVRQNLLFSRRCDQSLLDPVVKSLELGPLLDRDISGLSGGEARRVALGRALLTRPRLLLLDEPLSGLDWRMKHQLSGILLKVRSHFDTPLVFVSHDPGEIGLFCDQVWFLRDGRILAQGTPEEVFLRPDSVEAALVAGIENRWTGRIQHASATGTAIAVGGHSLYAEFDGSPGQSVVAVVPASEVLLSKTATPTSARNLWPGRVTRLESRVHGILVHMDCGALTAGGGSVEDAVAMTVLITPAAASELHLQPGDLVCALFKASSVRVFPV